MSEGGLARPGAEDGAMERTIAASFLLVHALMLGVLDLTVALASFVMGAGGVAVMADSGLQDASLLFGFAVVVGLIAATLLAWMGIEAMLAVRALRGSPRSLVTVSIGSMLLSLVVLIMNLVSCNFLGLGISAPMVLVAGVALAFAAIPVPVPRDQP